MWMGRNTEKDPQVNGMVVIGASTGGPAALSRILEGLPGGFPFPIVIIQHMMSGFTESLARRLDSVGPLKVQQAHAGMKLTPGEAVVAPGGQHLFFDRDCRVRLGFQEPRHGVRPSVDVTLESASELMRDRLVAVILTGMGKDGAQGARLVSEAGGVVLVQDEDSSTVFGMPKAVIKAGAFDVVLPLKTMAGHLRGVVSRLNEQAASGTSRKTGQKKRNNRWGGL